MPEKTMAANQPARFSIYQFAVLIGGFSWQGKASSFS